SNFMRVGRGPLFKGPIIDVKGTFCLKVSFYLLFKLIKDHFSTSGQKELANSQLILPYLIYGDDMQIVRALLNYKQFGASNYNNQLAMYRQYDLVNYNLERSCHFAQDLELILR
ncbi:hypothetical protein ACJX0J_026799, partial [Zea mays]